MHVISRKALREFSARFPDSEGALSHWYRIMTTTDFDNFAALRIALPTADKVGDLIVFNVGGNKYRLIVSIHFNRKKVYVRNVLTHREYDKGAWKQ